MGLSDHRERPSPGGPLVTGDAFETALRLDRETAIPLYHQIAEGLGNVITDRGLPPGTRLPTERDLAQLAGVSRMTARQALAQLADLGRIVIRHGQGIFVAEPKIATSALYLQAFSEAVADLGKRVTTEVVEQSISPAPASVARDLGISAGEPVVRLVRLRAIDGDPVLLETSQFAAERFAALATLDLADRSLYRVLARTFGVELTHATEAIEAAQIGEADARFMTLHPTAPALIVSGVAWEHDTPVERFRSVYRGDRFQLTLDTTRDWSRGESPRLSMVLAGVD